MDANCTTKCARLQVDNKVGSGRVLRSAHYLQHKQMTDVPVTSVGGDHWLGPCADVAGVSSVVTIHIVQSPYINMFVLSTSKHFHRLLLFPSDI